MVKALLKSIFFLALMLCMFCPAGMCSADESVSFDLATKWAGADLLKWQIGFRPVPARAENGSLVIDYPDDDGYLISPPLFLNANVNPFLVIKMKTSRSFQKARVYWVGPYNNNFDRRFSLPIAVGGNWGYHTYVIDMASHGGWSGNIGRLMISPVNGGGRVEMEGVEFLKYSPLLKFRSLLQEFYSLETNPVPPNLGMVFIINGPALGGKPVNNYIYMPAFYLLILLFLFLVVRSAYKSFLSDYVNLRVLPYKQSLLLAVFVTIAFIFLYWLVIETQYAFNDLKTLTADYQAMWGRTIEEKRDVITGGDFYDYLVFCDRALPGALGVDFVFSDNLYYAFPEWLPTKARYYLFPKYQDNKSPYKMVFGPGAEAKLDPAKKYSLFAKFKDNEVILKEVGQ